MNPGPQHVWLCKVTTALAVARARARPRFYLRAEAFTLQRMGPHARENATSLDVTWRARRAPRHPCAAPAPPPRRPRAAPAPRLASSSW